MSDTAARRLELNMLASWLRFQRAYEAVTELTPVAPEMEVRRRLSELEAIRRERDLAEAALFDRYRAILSGRLPDLSIDR